MEQNPELQLPATGLHLPSTRKRFGALLVDGMVMLLPTLLFFIFGIFKIDSTGIHFPWIPYILSIAVVLAFQYFCLLHWSRTPGKMVFSLYITDAATLQPKLSPKQALLRILSGFLSLPLSLAPMALAFFRPDRRQLADLIAGTQVMSEVPRKSPPKKRWIVGTLFVGYFGIMGLLNFTVSMKNFQFTAEEIFVPSKTD